MCGGNYRDIGGALGPGTFKRHTMLIKVAYKHADFAYALGDKIDINRGFEAMAERTSAKLLYFDVPLNPQN